jgi:hypothetical protein
MKKREKEEKDRRVVCLIIDPRTYIYIYKVCIQLHKYPNNNTSSFFFTIQVLRMTKGN